MTQKESTRRHDVSSSIYTLIGQTHVHKGHFRKRENFCSSQQCLNWAKIMCVYSVWCICSFALYGGLGGSGDRASAESDPRSSNNWCNLDSGYTTITDGYGYPHSVYVSATRDGGIWLRAGRDHASLDWTYVNETRVKLHSILLEPDTVHILESMNYTDYCVLTDVDMRITVDSGWHPSHLEVFDPRTRNNRIIMFRHNRDCHMTTNLTLTRDKQGLLCDGGRRNGCGRRYLPEAGRASPTVFIKSVNFDPKGADHWLCDDDATGDVDNRGDANSYTFVGSFYNVYVKLATCDPPRESRVWGHEAKLRPNKDELTNQILLTDPTQTALSDGVIKGWHMFAKSVSLQHGVHLQVWRPVGASDADSFTLVGETLCRPSELRFQELVLMPHQLIRVQQGDVLGLYFPAHSPLAWSSVPCATPAQRHRYATPPAGGVRTGVKLKFTVAPPGEHACRHYSFTAILTDKTGAKMIEDWLCPSISSTSTISKTIAFSTRRVHDGTGNAFANKGHVLKGHVLVADEGDNAEPQDWAANEGRLTEIIESAETNGVGGLEKISGDSARGKNGEGTGGEQRNRPLPLYIFLMTVSGLVLMLVLVGVASYFTALRS